MRHGIPRRHRYRPFNVAGIYERALAHEPTLDLGTIACLVEDELIFLADTHASVVYSLFERARRHSLCLAIRSKVGRAAAQQGAAAGAPAILTNGEAEFILALHARSERQARLRATSDESQSV